MKSFNQFVSEEGLRDWFGKSKSKDGKKGWVNVVTGGTCASDEPGEGTPKCVSSSKRASMSKSERLSASRRKKAADPGQQSKSGAAKPTYVSTDKKKKMNEEKDKKGKGSGKKDACYHKVKSRYSVFPSAYASGSLVQCRKKGAANWGNSTKKESYVPGKPAEKLGAVTDIPKDEREAAKKRLLDKARAKRKEKMSEASTLDELKCWKGYKRKKGATPGAPGSCVKASYSDWRGEMLNEIPEHILEQFVEEVMNKEEEVVEVLNMKKADMGDVVKDFYKSDAPQFKGKSKEKRRQMAVAAKLSANEEKNWIQGAIKKPGALHRELDVPEGEKIPAKKLNAAAKKGGKLGQRARLAKTLKKIKEEAAWQKKSGKNQEGGLNEKGRKSYERENPGSDLKAPVTKKPSELKKGSKSANRRKSFCARMGGMKKRLTSAKTANDPDSRINKALRKWNC